MATVGAEPVARRQELPKLLGLLVAGGAVAVALGVYGREHDPTGRQPYTLFFSSTINLKVWFATAVVVLACVQLFTAARLFGKVSVPRTLPSWWGDFHRLTGTLAFVVSLPVAYHCLWGLGYQTTTTRVAWHSALGCFFYGAFAVKVLAVRVSGLPNWTLPLAGGLLFSGLVAVWCTSSLWFFTSRPAGVPLF
jgi:hypothetical protein